MAFSPAKDHRCQLGSFTLDPELSAGWRHQFKPFPMETCAHLGQLYWDMVPGCAAAII